MIRGVVLGMGKIAQTGHMPAYSSESLRDIISISAAIEPNQKSRELALRQYPEMLFYDSVEQCFAEGSPDFVDICTPPHTHSSYIEQVLRHHTNILCEKPFSTDENEARMLAARLSSCDRVFMGCHQYRFSPIWKEFHRFRESMDESAPFCLQFDIYRTEADPGLKVNSEVWRTNKQVSGGGILADTGVHYLYLCYWLLGKPSTITARMKTLLYTGSEIEDTATVVFEYPNGIAEINLTWAADRRANSARFVARDKSLYYDGSSLTKFSYDKCEEIPVPDASDKKTYVTMYADLFREFAHQVQLKQKRQEWIDEAYQSVHLLETCYESSSSGKTIIVE